MYVPIIFVLFALQFTNVFTANILHLSIIASKSHYIWNKVLAKGIVAKGHNLTMVAPDQPDTDLFHSIVLEGAYEKMHELFDMNENVELSQLEVLEMFNELTQVQCDLYYNTEGLKKILSYPDDFKFDLIVYDMTMGPCMFVLIEKFNFPPIIGITPFLLPNYLAHLFGNHMYSLYVPWYGFPYTNKMSFFERFNNLIWNYIDIYYKNYLEFRREEKVAKEKFGIDKKPWSDIARDITLLFANTDPYLYYPQPLPPNIIPVGGLQALPSEKLPKDLEEFVNKSSNGIIVMSLGTNLRSDKLGEKTIRDILNAFGRMPENVLWKFESDNQNVPPNVFIRKWLPQNDVLGSPNVKLFIGHGGALSTQESMYHGVPILAIPFVVDQYINAKMLKEKGIGDEIDVKKITEEYFYNKIRKIIDNPTYRKNAKLISDSFKAQPQTPLERAVFWVEYVLKFGNPTFLNTPLRDMPWYQAVYLDIILFVVTVLSLSIYIVYSILKRIFKKSDKKLKLN